MCWSVWRGCAGCSRVKVYACIRVGSRRESLVEMIMAMVKMGLSASYGRDAPVQSCRYIASLAIGAVPPVFIQSRRVQSNMQGCHLYIRYE